MGSTKTVGAWVRNAGVWKATEAYMHHSGLWSNAGSAWNLEKGHVRVSGVWQVWATDLIRGLSTSSADRDRFDFDFNSPFFSEAGVQILQGGDIREKDSGSPYSTTSNAWLEYSNIHDLWNYGITISDDDSHNLDSATNFVDGVEELVSATYQFQSTRTTVGEESGRFSVKFTDWDSPGPKQVHLDFRVQVSIENNPF